MASSITNVLERLVAWARCSILCLVPAGSLRDIVSLTAAFCMVHLLEWRSVFMLHGVAVQSTAIQRNTFNHTRMIMSKASSDHCFFDSASNIEGYTSHGQHLRFIEHLKF